MISKETYQFLSDLKHNNNRGWFNSNKERFETAKFEFEQFIAELIRRIAEFDPGIEGLDPRRCIFRIYRDTRFSRDKSPYKTNLGAHLVATAAKPHDRAGYYVHIQPQKTFLAGGAYMPPAPWLKAIRESIAKEGKEFIRIINSPDFTGYFGAMSGEKLKTTPRDYTADHPYIDLLRHKSFLAMHEVPDKQAMSADFITHAARVFAALKPFDDFLNNALDMNSVS